MSKFYLYYETSILCLSSSLPYPPSTKIISDHFIGGNVSEGATTKGYIGIDGNNLAINIQGIGTDLESGKNWLSQNDVWAIYTLETPEEIPLTAEEVEALKDLTMYNHTTNLYADGADMSVTYYNNKLCAIDARVSALEERVAVIEAALISE